MNAGTVTAIIPTTGRPSVRRAVASAMRQANVTQVLVILDEPDQFPQVNSRLADLRCSIFQTAGRQGAASARNLGVRLAETDYVAFLDDDDEWVAEKTSLQLQDAGDQTVVASRAMLVGTSSRIVPELLYDPESSSLADYVLDRSSIQLRQNFMQTSTLLCSRNAALETPWAEGLSRHQDWDWLIRLQFAGLSVRQRPEVLVKVSQYSPGSISKSPDWRASEQWLRTLQSRVSERPAADFTASIVARGAFESRAWGSGAGALLQSMRNGAHLTALLVGASGILRSAQRHG